MKGLKRIESSDSCTTAIVTKGASADGSTFVTHSNDSLLSDPSIVFVPAKDHPRGAKRKIYPTALALEEIPEYDCYFTPRLIDAERAPGYDVKGLPPTKPLGEIDEVEHTYAYIDSDYGVMNEHGLMLGECTNNCARLSTLPAVDAKGIFYASELGRVALERCKTAREAVKLMGELIDRYGLWGTGETLLVADRDEGWVFECQMTPSGEGGLWIAQRVPDGEFFIAANQFRIRSIDPNDPDQLFNPTLPDQLEKLGWARRDERGLVDWVLSLEATEKKHPYNSLRRVWRGFQLVAPSIELPPRVEGWSTRAYPFSIKPDKPLTIEDIMNLHRDHYDGTEFDTTRGADAGPFGSPYRYDDDYKRQRAISKHNISYAWITQANSRLPRPIVWLSMHAPSESVYVPLAVLEMPLGFEQVDNRTFDPCKLWWIASQVTMLTRGFYSALIDLVREEARRLEAQSIDLIRASFDQTSEQSGEQFAEELRRNAARVRLWWQRLYAKLLARACSADGLKCADGTADDVERY